MEKIGEKINSVLFAQNHTAKWLAEFVKTIVCNLDYDFFKDLSDEVFQQER